MTLYDNEREDNAQPIPITINTRVPSKWRFVDLETNEVWYWDPAREMFRRTPGVQMNVRAELVPMDPAEYREWENQRAEELGQEPPFPTGGSQ